MKLALPIPYAPDPTIKRVGTSLWLSRGGFITDGALSSVNHLEAKNKLGVKVYYVHMDDANIRELNLIEPKLRQWGFKIAGWTMSREDPVDDAVRAAERVREFRLDGWVADHESPTESLPGSAETWLAEFRKRQPLAPLLLSCLPGPRPVSLAYHKWLDAGADIAPQCYQGEVGATGAVSWSAVAWIQRLNVPRIRIHPTLGVDKNNHPWSMGQYIAEMKQWGLGGYSLWHLSAIAPAV